MDLHGVALVTRAGTVRTERAAGLADAAAGVPCTPRTRFQLCSISKQFAAAATLLLAAGNLITNESLRAMLTPHAPIEDDDETLITTGYGYGMFTGTFAGEAAFYHPGDNPGYQSFAGWLPGLAASLVVLANDDSVNMTDLLKELLPVALDP